MAVAWPASLPKFSLYDSRSTTYAPALGEFIPDRGAAIRRVAASSANRKFSGTYRMTTVQMNDFWEFYRQTLNFGLDTFTVWDSEAQTNVEVQFASAEPPTARTIMRGWHDIDLAFEVIG